MTKTESQTKRRSAQKEKQAMTCEAYEFAEEAEEAKQEAYRYVE